MIHRRVFWVFITLLFIFAGCIGNPPAKTSSTTHAISTSSSVAASSTTLKPASTTQKATTTTWTVTTTTLPSITSITSTTSAVSTTIPGEYKPTIDPENFVETIDNKYYPLKPGTTYTYEGASDGEKQKNVMIVTDKKRSIMGVPTVVVHDQVFDGAGNLIEETFDWYAQDKQGNVWYFGEDSKEYEKKRVVSTAGSWEAGKNGALPGIIMKAKPLAGESWRQEYAKGEAEDMAQVLDVDESVTTVNGTFAHCVKTKDWTPLESGVVENKYYCPGKGVVRAEMVQGGSEKMELTVIKIG